MASLPSPPTPHTHTHTCTHSLTDPCLTPPRGWRDRFLLPHGGPGYGGIETGGSGYGRIETGGSGYGGIETGGSGYGRIETGGPGYGGIETGGPGYGGIETGGSGYGRIETGYGGIETGGSETERTVAQLLSPDALQCTGCQRWTRLLAVPRVFLSQLQKPSLNYQLPLKAKK